MKTSRRKLRHQITCSIREILKIETALKEIEQKKRFLRQEIKRRAGNLSHTKKEHERAIVNLGCEDKFVEFLERGIKKEESAIFNLNKTLIKHISLSEDYKKKINSSSESLSALCGKLGFDCNEEKRIFCISLTLYLRFLWMRMTGRGINMSYYLSGDYTIEYILKKLIQHRRAK